MRKISFGIQSALRAQVLPFLNLCIVRHLDEATDKRSINHT